MVPPEPFRSVVVSSFFFFSETPTNPPPIVRDMSRVVLERKTCSFSLFDFFSFLNFLGFHRCFKKRCFLFFSEFVFGKKRRNGREKEEKKTSHVSSSGATATTTTTSDRYETKERAGGFRVRRRVRGVQRRRCARRSFLGIVLNIK